MPSQQRVTARTILFTSIGSWAPERFVTLMGTSAEGGGLRLNPGCCGAACAAPEFDKGVLVAVGDCMAIFLQSKSDRADDGVRRNAAAPARRHAHPGRPSHESSETELHPFKGADRGRSSDSRALGLAGRFLMHAASRFDGGHRFSAIGMVCSHLPLRGSSGFAPDSLLAQHYVSGAAMGHKIWCFSTVVNGTAADRGAAS